MLNGAEHLMRIHVDTQACDGHALCHALAEEVYQVNEDTGRNEMGPFEVPEGLREAAIRGADACPERAIVVEP